jgi:threonine synthase
MDILISSNLERFLFEITGHDGGKVQDWMKELATEGHFIVEAENMERINGIIAAGFATRNETLDTIKKYFDESGYTFDTHTAVGMKVYEDYVKTTGDKSKTVLDATASPFKFNTSVQKAIKGQGAVEGKNEITILQELSDTIRMPIHPSLRDLDKKPILHSRLCEKDEIKNEVEEILGLIK